LRYSERIRTESRVDNSLTTWFQLFTTELARRTHLPTHGDSFMTGSKFRGLKSPELRHGDTKERRFCQAWLRKAPNSPNTWKRADMKMSNCLECTAAVHCHAKTKQNTLKSYVECVLVGRLWVVERKSNWKPSLASRD
jgi:hypothetical protein